MNETKKYELVADDTITVSGVKLLRIRALTTFKLITGRVVKKGDLGGYIEKEENLSHKGNAWVAHEAKVYNNAAVYGNAVISGGAEIYGNAEISDNATVRGKAEVYGNSWAYDNACIYGYALVCDEADVYGYARVYDNSVVYGCTDIEGNAEINGNAMIGSDDDYIVAKGLGSESKAITFFRTSDNNIFVKCGCFSGSLTEFEEKVKQTYEENNKYFKEYLAMIQVAKIHFELGD